MFEAIPLTFAGVLKYKKKLAINNQLNEATYDVIKIERQIRYPTRKSFVRLQTSTIYIFEIRKISILLYNDVI